ncbi:MAG: hypothetical protein MUF64_28860 [Polyangiaceae bacterium]|jgi:hypothetical protein|nr:hypothetical protein [Polyangiaceae bacterium]
MKKPIFRKIQGLLAGVTLLLVLACSPSSKNEQQYWDNHNKDVAEFSTRWPAYKGLLAAKQAKAKPLWDEASKVTDEKQKAEKMKAANEALHEGLLSKLNEIKYKSKSVEDTVGKLNALKLPKSKDGARDEAVRSAQGVLGGVNTALATAPANEEAAVALLSDQIGKLITASSNADRSLKSLKGK